MNYTVIGLGITGLSCISFLQKQGCKVQAIDTRDQPSNFNEFKSKFPNVPVSVGTLTLPADTDIIVLSPGISPHLSFIEEAKNKGIKVIGDIELFAQIVNVPVIAITGSNGKSTVATLLSKMIEASGISVGLCGNIGMPVLSALNDEKQIYVLELSSFQLETTYSLKPKAATVLNVSPDHLDRYSNFEDYNAAKLSIYNNAENIIVNREDPYTFPKSKKDNINSFGFDNPSDKQYGVISDSTGELYLSKGKEKIIAASELKIIGKQNILNALTALALSEIINLPIENCKAVLRTFSGLPHRCELIGKFLNALWINDSKGTNVGATVSAIDSIASQIKGKIVIILGGISKGADFSPLLKPVVRNCKAVIAIGESKDLFKKLFDKKIPYYEANDMQQCVTIAKQNVKDGDAVLLSPACSSLDMFENFEDRGLVFKLAVFSEI